jgi:hypothetical protein
MRFDELLFCAAKLLLGDNAQLFLQFTATMDTPKTHIYKVNAAGTMIRSNLAE